ncbi:MAG TPA: class I SAM-dependent methyltransferase [Polyangiales bacterium]
MNLLLDLVVPQLARPRGPLGRLLAPVLDRGNRTINLHVVGALELEAGHRVLEVGFGGGVGLALALAHEPRITLAGLDPSSDMVERCRRRFGDRVELQQGVVESLPWPDRTFDRIFGVNVTYFWPDLRAALAELQRVLAPNGMLAFGIRPPETLQRFQFAAAGHRVWTPAQYVEALGAAGFIDASARRMPDEGGGAFVLTARSRA